MAYIDNSETKAELVKAIRGNSSSNIPSNKVNDTSPTIEINPMVVKECDFLRTWESSASGTFTALTTSSVKTTYINSIQFSIIKNGACDLATGNINLYAVSGGQTITLIRLPTITLTADTRDVTISYPHPVKIDKNSTITVTGSFTSGVLLRAMSLTGFELEQS